MAAPKYRSSLKSSKARSLGWGCSGVTSRPLAASSAVILASTSGCVAMKNLHVQSGGRTTEATSFSHLHASHQRERRQSVTRRSRWLSRAESAQRPRHGVTGCIMPGEKHHPCKRVAHSRVVSDSCWTSSESTNMQHPAPQAVGPPSATQGFLL